MTILNFSYATLKDPQAFQDYVKQAARLMQQMDVEVVVRGKHLETKRGQDPAGQIAAVFRFKDLEAANAFYTFPDYQTLIPLRDKACDMTIHFYEE